jgi:hypothetical protein
MDERYSTKRLLVLRKLTRAIADLLRGQLTEYLATLSYLFRPRTLLGEFVQSGTKETVPGAEKAFKDLQRLYEAVAVPKPFYLPEELTPPVEIVSPAVDLSPVEYGYLAKAGGQSKRVAITSPLRWVLHYAGYSPRRLWDVMADAKRTVEQVQEVVIHGLVMNLMVTRQPGLVKILEGLHFSLQPVRREDLYYGLPLPSLGCAVTTVRPPDEVILESTELSGMGAFEEVVNPEEIDRMRDPFKERLLELVKSHGIDLPPREPEPPPA